MWERNHSKDDSSEISRIRERDLFLIWGVGLGSDWKSQQTSMLFSRRIMTVESTMGKSNRKEKHMHAFKGGTIVTSPAISLYSVITDNNKQLIICIYTLIENVKLPDGSSSSLLGLMIQFQFLESKWWREPTAGCPLTFKHPPQMNN